MIVVLNRAAGSSIDEAAIRDEFARNRLTAEFRSIDSFTRESAADETIVAAGGDGTISAVAGLLAGTDKTLGVLPLGTLNHFAKDLHIPLDLGPAVETIAHQNVAQVDVAEVNGRVFINNSSLGLYPHIVANREAQQERFARGKWAAFFWAALRALRRFPFTTLRITVGDQQLVRQTAFVFVGNNEYEIAGFNLGARRCLDRGHLGLYLTHGTGRLGLFRLGLRALLGRLEQAREFEIFCVREAIIKTRKRRVLVATDGEVNWFETPLHYRIRPAALRVIVPRETT